MPKALTANMDELEPYETRDKKLFVRIKQSNFDWLEEKAAELGYSVAEVVDFMIESTKDAD